MVFGFGLETVLLFVVILWFRWKHSRSKESVQMINKIPGPMAWPLVGNIVELLEPRERVLENVMKRQKKYGTFFRVWVGTRPLVILGRPEHIEIVLRSSMHTEKSFFYRFLRPWLGTGLLTSHGPKWAAHRKMITPTFHFKVLQGFVDVFYENAKILAEKMRENAETGTEVDVYPLVTKCTLDIICETAMGTKVHAQSEEENEYVNSVYRLSALVIHRMNRIWLHPDLFFRFSSAGAEFYKHLNTVQGFTNRVIKSRREALGRTRLPDEDERKQTSFLDLLLEAGGSKLNDEEIREEVETFMFEGHDTTASGISWTLSVLGCHPGIQEECYQEVKAIFENDPDRVPTLADLTEMKLLERVIKEALRMYPSVVSISRTLEENIQCGEYVVPKGTDAVISIYSMHMNPEYYPNPEKFDPDRFLPENSLNRHPYSYLPFSAGPRNCIGQKFALFEEKAVLSTLLRKYKFESVQPTEKTVHIPDLVLRPGAGIKMKISRR